MYYWKQYTHLAHFTRYWKAHVMVWLIQYRHYTVGWTTEFISWQEQWWDSFLFTASSRLGLGSTQPPIQWVPGALTLGVKWPRA